MSIDFFIGMCWLLGDVVIGCMACYVVAVTFYGINLVVK